MAFQALIILIGIIIGWAKKGSVWSVTNLRLHGIWLLPIAYILQRVSIRYLTGSMYELVLIFSYVTLLAFCTLNFRTPGVVWTLAGTAANMVVMLFNGLRMPAYLPAVKMLDPAAIPLLLKGQVGKSIAMTSHTHLNFLGDIFSFDITPASLISIGDILFAIGLVILVQHAMRCPRKEPLHAN